MRQTISHVSPQGYESYLKGHFRNRNRKADVEQSIANFERKVGLLHQIRGPSRWVWVVAVARAVRAS